MLLTGKVHEMNDETYIIEENIPMMKDGRKRSGLRHVLKTMKYMNSFVIPSSQYRNVYANAKAVGVRIVTRKLDENTYRVWKVEKWFNAKDYDPEIIIEEFKEEIPV